VIVWQTMAGNETEGWNSTGRYVPLLATINDESAKKTTTKPPEK